MYFCKPSFFHSENHLFNPSPSPYTSVASDCHTECHVWMGHGLTSSLFDGHPSCFQALATVDKATVKHLRMNVSCVNACCLSCLFLHHCAHHHTAYGVLYFFSWFVVCSVHNDINREGISVSCVLLHPQGLKHCLVCGRFLVSV